MTAVVGVYLVSETNSQPSHSLGSVILPEKHLSGKEIREIVSLVLGEAKSRNFSFLTKHGWEVNEKMEHAVNVDNLLWEDSSLRIRLKFSRTRLALLVHGAQSGSDQVLGFIFVDGVHSHLSSLRKDIATQHPDLDRRLNERGFVFVDNNGWPVSPSQENLLLVLDVVQNHSVYISPSVVPLSLTNQHTFRPSLLSLPSSTANGGCQDLSTDSTDFGQSNLSSTTPNSCQILISYVHKEATTAATELKAELEKLQYSVFLDVDCIEIGTDWQDSLNNAVSNCSIFVPLVTNDYGRTLWTNREIKLADILGKLIVPVNFLSNWPPPCLAIQFATTQFLSWSSSQVNAAQVAAGIANVAAIDNKRRVATDDGEESIDGSYTPTALTKVPSLKSCGSLLPKNTPSSFSQAVLQPRDGKPLVLVLTHELQDQFTRKISAQLMDKGYEVWTSVSSKMNLEEFKEQVAEAGAVIFILSKEFSCCDQCEQKVYYSEGRKRIVPVILEDFAMPPWMSTLIGTNTFLDARSSNFKATLLGRVKVAINPITAEEEMRKTKHEEEELSRLTSALSQQLPKQRLVYISGGTKFFSKKGEQICREFGQQLARKKDVTLVTGGFYGVGETVGLSFSKERAMLQQPEGVVHVIAQRDSQDKSTQTRQNPDGSFPLLPYGRTLVHGNSVRQRELLVPRVLEVCVLIEGGPGAAFEAEQFSWNGHLVIPVPVTGGAASGLFSVPQSLFVRPLGVAEADWLSLKDDTISPSEVAAAMVRIIDAVMR